MYFNFTSRSISMISYYAAETQFLSLFKSCSLIKPATQAHNLIRDLHDPLPSKFA